MMIKEVSVTATATKQYNKFEVSLTAEIVDNTDFENLKDIAIKKAIAGIDQLVSSSNAPAEVKVETTPVEPTTTNQAPQTVQNPYYNNSYYANQINKPQVNNNTKMASEKQIALLKKCRYNLDWENLTATEASQYIKEALERK